MALLKDLTVYGATRLIADTFAAMIYSDGFHHNSHDNNDSVLLAGGGYKALSDFTAIGKDGYIPYPRDGKYTTTSAQITGALCIELPVSWTNTMLKFEVDIYNYRENTSVTYIVGGRNNSNTWYSTTAYSLRYQNNSEGNLTVRFGHNGTHCCIYIGETNQLWQCPQVVVRNFHAGCTNYDYNTWASGWVVSFVTSFGAISIGETIENPAINYFANNAIQLATVRSINGTSFNGTADITTSTWGTARNITIGNKLKSVNGSKNVTWTLAEIGAAPSSHVHNFTLGSSLIQTGDLCTSIAGPLTILTNNQNKFFIISDYDQNIKTEHYISSTDYYITTNCNSIRFGFGSTYNSSSFFVQLDDGGAFYPNNDNSGTIGIASHKWANIYCYNINGYTYNTPSDIKLKYDIRDILNEDINKLFATENGFIRHYKWRETNKDSYGFIAQELLEYCPEAVDFNSDNALYSVNYNVAFAKIIGAMFKKIKEQEQIIQQLKEKVLQ